MFGVSSPFSPLSIALAALVASVSINLLTARRLALTLAQCERLSSNDDSGYSYVGDDHPVQLPISLPYVSLKIENTEKYGVSNRDAWAEWRTTDAFEAANGFVRLGPQGRAFSISMFHQMHCLQKIRGAVLDSRWANSHTHHCLNLLRQAILCASDTTLDPLDRTGENGMVGADGVGTVHVCRDWEKVYEFVHENHKSEAWNSSSSTAM